MLKAPKKELFFIFLPSKIGYETPEDTSCSAGLSWD